MSHMEEFKQMLLNLPLAPEEVGYFMTKVYENGGILDNETREALLERIDIALNDNEDAKNSIQTALMEFENSRLKKEIDVVQKKYDKEIAEIRSKNLPHDQEQAEIAKLDEKYGPMFAPFE